jgi:hypothetical protein
VRSGDASTRDAPVARRRSGAAAAKLTSPGNRVEILVDHDRQPLHPTVDAPSTRGA